MKSEMPLVPSGAPSMRVLAGGDEDLLAGNLVGAVGLRHGLGAQEPEVGAAMGLRQVHGACPGAFHHLRQVGGLLFVRAMHEDRGDRALRQARIHGERHVGRRHVFADGGVEHIGKALAAEFLRHGKADPAALPVEVVSLLEALRRRHRGVLVAHAAFLVAGKVDREQHLLGELGRLAGNRLHHVPRRVGEARQVVVALQRQNVVQDEKRVIHGGLVDRHVSRSSPMPRTKSAPWGWIL